MKNFFEHKILPEKSLGYVKRIFNNERFSVLDLGSSNALFAKLYKNNIKIYHAFDTNKKAVLSGKQFLKNDCDFDWNIQVANIKNYEKFSIKFKRLLLNKYDIIVFNRVFHRLYDFRLYKKWKKGRYRSKNYKLFDLLFHSFKMCKKWYIFSTTIRHMNYFELIDFFKLNNFELIFENKFDDNDKQSLHPWSCIFKSNVRD